MLAAETWDSQETVSALRGPSSEQGGSVHRLQVHWGLSAGLCVSLCRYVHASMFMCTCAQHLYAV